MSKIATEKDMLEIGKLDISTITAPYRCHTFTELYEYNCKLKPSTSNIYSSNQCVMIDDLEKCEIDAVDLGLSVKWGNMNLGATTSRHVGNYYAWGETLPKDIYSLSTYNFYSTDVSCYSKYIITSAEGIIDNKTILDPEDDAVQVNFGSKWRIPTEAEWYELITKCTWTTINDTVLKKTIGYKITGPNGHYIELIANGYKDGDSDAYNLLQEGYYWTNELYNSQSSFKNSRNAINFYFTTDSSNEKNIYSSPRYIGLAIRPVYGTQVPFFVIKFVNYDGNTLQIIKVNKGQIPVYSGSTPTRIGDKYFTYTFSGWSPSIVAATADVIYTAQFTKQYKSGYGKATTDPSSGRTSCQWVQLWENGPKWAEFNVGSSITNYANLINQQDSTPFYGFNDLATSYNTVNVGGLYLYYNSNLNGRKCQWTEDEPIGSDDVARTLWGNNWKTPSQIDLERLISTTYTTWTWCNGDTIQYVSGCTLTGFKVSGIGAYADKSIFLPAGGAYSPAGIYFQGVTFDEAGIYFTSFGGFYASNTQNTETSKYFGLSFTSTVSKGQVSEGNLTLGLSVRPILA